MEYRIRCNTAPEDWVLCYLIDKVGQHERSYATESFDGNRRRQFRAWRTAALRQAADDIRECLSPGGLRAKKGSPDRVRLSRADGAAAQRRRCRSSDCERRAAATRSARNNARRCLVR